MFLLQFFMCKLRLLNKLLKFLTLQLLHSCIYSMYIYARLHILFSKHPAEIKYLKINHKSSLLQRRRVLSLIAFSVFVFAMHNKEVRQQGFEFDCPYQARRSKHQSKNDDYSLNASRKK